LKPSDVKSVLTFLMLLSPPLLAVPGSISAGGYHFTGIADGQALGMGDGTYGQLGTNPSGTPASVVGLTNVSQVAAGVFSTIALKTDGSVWFLGDHSVQHTTAHGTPQAVTTPLQVPGLAGIDRIAAGHRHFLALDTDTGNLFAWGHNGSGQLGNDSLLDLSNPALVLTDVAAMAAGNGFSAAVRTNGELWTWGRNSHGQLGLGDTMDRHVPTQVPGLANAAAVAAGGNHLLLLLTDQTVRSCGDNSFGQLGNNSTVRAISPVAVAGLSGITAITAGWNHSAALGTITYLWGRNLEGQCGGGPASPVQLAVPTVLTLIHPVAAISCGGNFTILTLANDALWGCGSNADGQLDGTSAADPVNPQNVLTPQLVIQSADSDNDGLPDSWETHHFENLDQSGTDDFDNDGTSNRIEYLLALDPKNGSSFFQAWFDGQDLQWPGAAGLAFLIQRSATLAAGSWSTIASPTGVDGINSHTDPSPLPGRGFYRVVLSDP
jgi:alpha-tubulin suppressor-like RCC1 family protein